MKFKKASVCLIPLIKRNTLRYKIAEAGGFLDLNALLDDRFKTESNFQAEARAPIIHLVPKEQLTEESLDRTSFHGETRNYGQFQSGNMFANLHNFTGNNNDLHLELNKNDDIHK